MERQTRITHIDEIQRSREVAEASRESEWQGAGFLRDLFLGQFRLNLSLPLYNQLNRERTIINAGIATANAEASLRDQQLAAQQSLVQATTALRTAQQQITLQTQSVTAAEEDLRVQQQRYQLGVSTVLDVLTSQTQLNQARLALVQARFAARTARAQLEALAGRSLTAAAP